MKLHRIIHSFTGQDYREERGRGREKARSVMDKGGATQRPMIKSVLNEFTFILVVNMGNCLSIPHGKCDIGIDRMEE